MISAYLYNVVPTTMGRGLTVLADRPDDACPRFQIKGWCFENCPLPHCPVPAGPQTTKMDNFVKKCRRLAGNQ